MLYPVMFPYLGFLVAGVADAYAENTTAHDRARAMLEAFGLELVGIFGYFVVLMLGGLVVYQGGVEPQADIQEHVAQVRAARVAGSRP